jgi:hypothetical protein
MRHFFFPYSEVDNPKDLPDNTRIYNTREGLFYQYEDVANLEDLANYLFDMIRNKFDDPKGIISKIIAGDVYSKDEVIDVVGAGGKGAVLMLFYQISNIKNDIQLDKTQYRDVTNIKRLKENVMLKTITIEKDSSTGEYRVPSEDGYEDGAYYTDDKKDAEGVAFKVFGKDIIIKYRSVREFVGGKYEKYRPKKIKENVMSNNFDRMLGILSEAKQTEKEKLDKIKGKVKAKIASIKEKIVELTAEFKQCKADKNTKQCKKLEEKIAKLKEELAELKKPACS